MTYVGTNDLQGHWRASLDLLPWLGVNHTAKVVLHIARLPGGSFAASLQAIDHDALFLPTNLPCDIPATSLGYAPPDVALEWKSFGYSFEGRLEDGKLSGLANVDGQKLPLVFERAQAK